MERSLKSFQRGVRTLNFICNAAGTALSGLDALKVSMTDTGTGVKTIELGSNGFASADYIVQLTDATTGVASEVSITDANTFVINQFDRATGATPTDGIVHVTVIGSVVTDRY